MAHIIADRIKETTTTTGTGSVTLAGAATGYRAFSAVCANNDTLYYTIELGSEWEVGLGTWTTGGVLVRTTPLAGSAATPVSFSAGSKTVFLTHPATATASKQHANSWALAQTALGINISGAAATNRQLLFQTAGVTRWEFVVDNAAEGGSNSGSNLQLNTYTDAGAYQSTPWSIIRNGGAMNISILTLSSDLAIADGGTGSSTALAARQALGIPMKGHIYGLGMSNAADTLNDITIAAGEAASDDGTDILVLAAARTKQLDATWAVGDNAGGLNTGAEAVSTWYEVHLIKRADTGVVDVMFTTTANRATLPTNYTLKRRIGWIRNDAASAILQFTQVDDYFTLTTQVNDVSATVTATAAAVALTAPPSTVARFRATGTSNASVNGPLVTSFSEIVEGNVTPADTTGIGSIGFLDITGATAAHFELRVSSTSTIEHDSSAATGSPTFDISTYGWIDTRGDVSNV